MQQDKSFIIPSAFSKNEGQPCSLWLAARCKIEATVPKMQPGYKLLQLQMRRPRFIGAARFILHYSLARGAAAAFREKPVGALKFPPLTAMTFLYAPLSYEVRCHANGRARAWGNPGVAAGLQL